MASTTATWTVLSNNPGKVYPTTSMVVNPSHHTQHTTNSSSVIITTSGSVHRESSTNGHSSPYATRSSSMDGDGNSSVTSVATPVRNLQSPSSPSRSRSPSCHYPNASGAPSAASLLQAVKASMSPSSPVSQSSGSGNGITFGAIGGTGGGISVPPLPTGSTSAVHRSMTTQHTLFHNGHHVGKPTTISTPNGSINGSASDRKKKVRKYECDYDVNPTELYQAIERRKWAEAMEILDREEDDGEDDDELSAEKSADGAGKDGNDNDGKADAKDGKTENPANKNSLPSSPSVQAATWVVRKERDGRLRWRLLPLHAAVIFHSPLPLIESLLLAYPDAPRCKDDQGMLPLHLAFRNGAADDVITELLASYPPAVTVRDRKGRDPLDCAIQSRSQPALSKRGTLLRTYAEVAVASARASAASDIQSSMDRTFKLQQAEHAAEMERVKMSFDKQILERIEQVGLIEREMAAVRKENQELARKLALSQRGERDLTDRATDLGRALRDSRQELEEERRRHIVELRRLKAAAVAGGSVETLSSSMFSARLALLGHGGSSSLAQIDDLEDECDRLRKKLERMTDVVRDAISHQDHMTEKLEIMEQTEKERVRKIGELFKIEASAISNTSEEAAMVREKSKNIRQELENLVDDTSPESFSNDEESDNPAVASSDDMAREEAL